MEKMRFLILAPNNGPLEGDYRVVVGGVLGRDLIEIERISSPAPTITFGGTVTVEDVPSKSGT
jgi:hypothetical protein